MATDLRSIPSRWVPVGSVTKLTPVTFRLGALRGTAQAFPHGGDLLWPPRFPGTAGVSPTERAEPPGPSADIGHAQGAMGPIGFLAKLAHSGTLKHAPLASMLLAPRPPINSRRFIQSPCRRGNAFESIAPAGRIGRHSSAESAPRTSMLWRSTPRDVVRGAHIVCCATYRTFLT